MHSMIRVDEVEKRGQSKILDLDENANVTPFPSQFYPPSNSSD
jgi:hypothetical protein